MVQSLNVATHFEQVCLMSTGSCRTSWTRYEWKNKKAFARLNAIYLYFPAAGSPCFKYSIIDYQHHLIIMVIMSLLISPNQTEAGLPAGVRHYSSFVELYPTRKNRNRKKDKDHSASHLEEVQIEGEMKRAGTTFASHPSECVPSDGLGAAHHVYCQSYWSDWPFKPAKAGKAPVLMPRGTHAHQGIWQ